MRKVRRQAHLLKSRRLHCFSVRPPALLHSPNRSRSGIGHSPNRNSSAGGHLLVRLKPDKKHRMSIRCVNRGKTMFTSKLDTCFCPCLPAVRTVTPNHLSGLTAASTWISRRASGSVFKGSPERMAKSACFPGEIVPFSPPRNTARPRWP